MELYLFSIYDVMARTLTTLPVRMSIAVYSMTHVQCQQQVTVNAGILIGLEFYSMMSQQLQKRVFVHNKTLVHSGMQARHWRFTLLFKYSLCVYISALFSTT